MARWARKGGDLEAIREALYDLMWDDVGILRTAEGLARGAGGARRAVVAKSSPPACPTPIAATI